MAEVEKIMPCPNPKCNRDDFFIPNEPKYTQYARAERLRTQSLAKASSSFGLQLEIQNLHFPSDSFDSEENRWEIPKSERQKSPKIRTPEVLLFPERGEPYVSQEENWFWVIAEYPSHNKIEQIQITVLKETLILQSTLLLCPYKDIIEGLGLFINIFEENLRNGILEVKLKE